MAMEGRSAAIAIGGGRRPADAFDVSMLSQSLPVKPRSLAAVAPALEPPPLELPKSSPGEGLVCASGSLVDEEVGRTLIRYSADISAEEFSCSPAERQVFLSQSCPAWGHFGVQRAQPDVAAWRREKAPEEMPEPGAVLVPGRKSSFESSLLESEIIAQSPTILESFKMYKGNAAEAAEEEPAVGPGGLEEIVEEEEVVPVAGDDDEDEDQFSLEA